MATYIIYKLPDHFSGNTFEGAQFTITVNGAPLNLTGAEIRMILPNKTFSSKTGGLIINDAPAGKFQFAKQLITLQPGKVNYYISITLSDGTIKTYIRGTWRIL